MTEEDFETCLVCGEEADFEKTFTYNCGITKTFFLCEKHFNELEEEEQKENIVWACIKGRIPSDYDLEIPVKTIYEYPFQRTYFEDGSFFVELMEGLNEKV